ncbi:hypothetical protein [Paenibacillus sp. CGMCC 1.18879]|uniref:hypothetical protein n=2 Tax=Paenibacillus TaxID=44249 RepID=UPI001CA7D747|nr:hypothetical protein [Paenibacillus sp. CGMCC 1.18879]MBY9078846.1 hypothetical protein [Paenibacillus sp. CGMCC 1.18879]
MFCARRFTLICLILSISIISSCTETDNRIGRGNYESSPAFASDAGVESAENPIDQAFKKDFEIVSSTYEMNYVASTYLDAWRAEWGNVVAELMKHYEFEGDKNTIREYKSRYEEFATQASELEWIDWSDTSVEPGEDRSFGTGAVSASFLEEAVLLKRQVLYLIDKYFSAEDSEYGEYIYLYKGNGAELDKAK